MTPDEFDTLNENLAQIDKLITNLITIALGMVGLVSCIGAALVIILVAILKAVTPR